MGEIQGQVTVVDVNLDGTLEIIAADTKGNVAVFDSHGKELWERHTGHLIAQVSSFFLEEQLSFLISGGILGFSPFGFFTLLFVLSSLSFFPFVFKHCTFKSLTLSTTQFYFLFPQLNHPHYFLLPSISFFNFIFPLFVLLL